MCLVEKVTLEGLARESCRAKVMFFQPARTPRRVAHEARRAFEDVSVNGKNVGRHPEQREGIAQLGGEQPRISQHRDVCLGNHVFLGECLERAQGFRALNGRHRARVAQLKQLHEPFNVAQ